MDPIQSIQPAKDSTLAMLLAAEKKGWQIYYLELAHLFLQDDAAWGEMRPLTVRDDLDCWFSLKEPETQPLGTLDIILMRKDPPVDRQYLNATYILEYAEASGTLVVNSPRGLRNISEKFFIHTFPECIAPTLVTSNIARLRTFVNEQGKVIIKPLDQMGGESVYLISPEDKNTSVILNDMTEHGRTFIVAQRYLKEISAGDKRVLLIDGEPVPYALARIPRKGETRGNLVAGGIGKGVALSDRDRFICQRVGKRLSAEGVYFAGLDIIGEYLTEVNVTSPTCIRELDRLYHIDIAMDLMEKIERRRPMQQGARQITAPTSPLSGS